MSRKLEPPKRVRWLSIVGARPQFVKLAAICRAIEAHNQAQARPVIEHCIIHTGQCHSQEAAELFFLQLDIPNPNYDLEASSSSYGAQSAHLIERMEPILNTENPDWVIVYDDTNSAAAGALLASRLGCAVAHVEAGCRSHLWQTPEEQNRVVVDHLSQLLLAPSRKAVENLHREGIGVEGDPRRRTVVLVGDAMYDMLSANLTTVMRLTKRNMDRFQLKPKGYYLLTLCQAEIIQNRARLLQLLTALQNLDLPVLFPVHRQIWKALGDQPFPAGKTNVRVISPMGYLDMLSLEKSARKILTDSGGVQKEAFYLRVPCITLREETEWPETVELGFNRLTGTDRRKILDAVRETAPSFSGTSSPFGNGRAGERIVKALATESATNLGVGRNKLSLALQD